MRYLYPQMMTIATWNVNSLRVRLPHVLDWWQAHQPDVLCLQETKMENAAFPFATLAERGLYCAAHGQKTYNGVAIISRFPLSDIHTGFDGADFEDQTRVLAATVRGVRIINVYVINGEDVNSPRFALKEMFFRHLTDYVHQQMKLYPKLVLCGDFNVAADARDVANPIRAEGKLLFSQPERRWFAELQDTTGLRDALRVVDDSGGIYSWWDYRFSTAASNAGMRIDYLLLSPALCDSLAKVNHHTEERAKPQPSDHVPVTITL